MLTLKERNLEPIPGYRLLEPLGRGGFGEVWKCLAPGGLYKAIKFVSEDPAGNMGLERAPAVEELEAIQRVKSVRHPFLLSMERVEISDGELIIVMELADRSLLDLLNQRRSAGHKGIERDELLGYLREAANVLDHMNFQHGLQHLDIKPANLFLIADHVKVADFGLVQNLSGNENDSTVSLAAITPLYAAPELFRNRPSSSCDQYSLAVVYQELMTGTLPFVGKNSRQLMLQHTAEPPNLEPLDELDRAVIARALEKDPARRFGSCTELIQALQHGDAHLSSNALSTIQMSRARTDTQSDLSLPSIQGGVESRGRSGPAQAKYLPDYTFQSCLGRTPSSENWEAHSSEGRRSLVRFLFGVVGHNPRREQEAITRLQALQHDVLPPIRLLPAGPGCLIALTELFDSSLRDRYQEARSKGATGLPRRQLLDWLWTAAEALDELAKQQALNHLALNPRSVMFKGNRVQLNDFGLMPLVWQPAGQMPMQLQARYAAPEVAQMRGVHGSDQYSLAVIFQEMLTGEHPFRGRQPGAPNLTPLPAEDRPILARALDVNPEKRFPSCVAMFEALDRIEAEAAAALVVGLTGSNRIMAELVAEASAASVVLEPETWLNCPDGEVVLRSRFAASLPGTNTSKAFEEFRKQWNGQILSNSKDGLTLAIGMPTQFWKRLFGRPPGLIVDLQWVRARPPVVPLPEITVHIRGADKGSRSNTSLLRQIGPAVLESLRAYLHKHPERRVQERRLWTGSVEASFLLPDGQYSDTVVAHGKDVSLTGMGLYLPCVVPGSDIKLSVHTASRPTPVLLSGKCVRVQRCGDELYEAGILIE
jgi:serine/threonine protein kinase